MLDSWPRVARLPLTAYRQHEDLGQLLMLNASSCCLTEQVKAVLRETRLRQLLVVEQVDRSVGVDTPATRLHLSGPLALFHGTKRYGRALAQWLPVGGAATGAIWPG